MMRGWGDGWWVVGAAFMVFCMWMMARMMMGHGPSGQGERRGLDEPERTLADRLARGDIDVDEYNRLLETLRHGDRSGAHEGSD